MNKSTVLLCAIVSLGSLSSRQAQTTTGETGPAVVLPVTPALNTVPVRLPFLRPGPNDLEKFVEPVLANTVIDTASWDRLDNRIYSGFVSSNTRFARHEVPAGAAVANGSLWQEKAWIGERINTQVLVWSKTKVSDISVETDTLRSPSGDRLPDSALKTGFVRYVLSDATAGACGTLEGKDLTPFLVADAIDPANRTGLPAQSVQPVWVTIAIPATARPGVYSGLLKIYANGKGAPISKLKVQIEVLYKKLPAPSEWGYHLDLWQHPLHVADFYQVKPWSAEHFAKMRPAMEMLRDAGQKVITTCVLWDQFNGRSRGLDNAYIKPIKKKDGSWKYDYTNFDKWVGFMMSAGINKQINCYGPAPWVNQFFYYDESSQAEAVVKAEPGSKPYEEYWQPLLSDFRDHLKEKGWFAITNLGIDERGLPATEAAISLIKKVDPNFKVAYSGKYFPMLQEKIDDYSLTLKTMPEDTKAERKRLGKVSTFYTCCWESSPNTFTVSNPADATWLSWFSAANDFDGYVRWAYDAWESNNLNDSRNTQVPAGDNFLIYPGARNSIRFEKLIEGVQDFEKIRILKAGYVSDGNRAGQARIDKLLADFKKFGDVPTSTAAMVTKARATLNTLN